MMILVKTVRSKDDYFSERVIKIKAPNDQMNGDWAKWFFFKTKLIRPWPFLKVLTCDSTNVEQTPYHCANQPVNCDLMTSRGFSGFI